MQQNNMQQNPFNFNNQGNGSNPFANMFGQGMFEKPPLSKLIKRWVKITIYLIIFISFIQGCFMDKIPTTGGVNQDSTISEFWGWAGFFGVVFVWPLTQLSYLMNSFFGSFTPETVAVVLSILIIVFLVKGGTLVFMWKSIKQQGQMQELQASMAVIKAKYEGRTDAASKQMMQQEMMGLYQKMGINPLGAMGSMFITMPFFFAMYRLISKVDLFRDAEMFNHSYSDQIVHFSKLGEAFNNPILLVLVIATTAIQVTAMLLPQIQASRRRKASNKVMTAAAKAQLAQQQKMMYFMAIFFIFIIVNLPLGLTIYWLFTGTWSIFQTLFVQKKVHNKGKAKRVKEKVKYT